MIAQNGSGVSTGTFGPIAAHRVTSDDYGGIVTSAQQQQLSGTNGTTITPGRDYDLAHPKPGEIEAFIRQAARMRGIDDDLVIKGVNHEGGTEEPARHGVFDTGESWYPLQIHYGGPEYPQFGIPGKSVAGMGNGFTALTGWQPGDPRGWRDSVRYGLNRAKLSGWGAWYGFAAEGITGFDGIDRSFRWDANSERWDFEDGIPGLLPLYYDPNQPPERQIADYACSIRTATWMLKSVGVDTDAAEMHEYMVPKYVTPEDGLRFGSGVGLAEVLRAKLPAGTSVTVHPNASFEQVREWAGKGPIGMGSGELYHWLAIREPDGEDALSGMNPAPAWKAVGDQITREEFDDWAPWNVVRVTL